ncbi:MAG TPA: peptide MFS transporter [Pyrinomonadaceae bacterium]|jgi:POT family proton-dependent oligopeptide transporter|nr:peptide MFS transporter [Pyrinomonadaceae bacterium]
MSEAAMTGAPPRLEVARRESIFAGHPKGLGPLFFTELWERFSYYGMRAILIFYLTSTAAEGGLGWQVKDASAIWGWYVFSVYITALPGGLIADYLTGARNAVFLGGCVIAAGHFSMIVHSPTFFYGGLALIAIGTGLLKPNISAMVGGLYKENDPRRDSGFSIFYMGINIGAMMAPLVVGYFAKGESFKSFLRWMGMDPTMSWHWGFGASGFGMVVGLLVYLWNRNRLAHVGNTVKTRSKLKAEEAKAEKDVQPALTRGDWKRIAAIFIFFTFTILFWAAYEQKGASLNLFADRLTNTVLFGWKFPAPYLQSLTPAFVIMLAPIFSILWVRLGDRQPSSPVKFTLGLIFIGMAYLLLVPAAMLTAQGRISFWWLVGLYFLEVCGEMCLSPVGLSTVTKLAPPKLVGIMMGVWFLAAAFGNKLAGYLSGFFVSDNPMQLVKLYGGIAAGLLASALLLALLTPTVKRLMRRDDLKTTD